ncbi:GNAT family N-acetyltransferase [Marivibrio halodurans]|uniref:GNAT family N-acetyltransferase n=1 Tax=Marivibrio halodurans TaxID=2039722 RepID=A0A8J7V0E8_9PROT|nr:GNAT family N-acetyltransferase [Marivibrio halodurans]MBP5856726.1 GNAT family N-acetyltransferase [Marivibrio halodurans]
MTIRDARAEDLDAIVRLLAEDSLGAVPEEPGADSYRRAFAAIEESPDNRLLVAEHDGAVVGTFQLTFIPNLSLHGGPRAQIEAVRVASALRGRGIGEAMMRWAIERAGEAGCVLVQLTSNARRADARRFYERVGFVASHVGFKYVPPQDR